MFIFWWQVIEYRTYNTCSLLTHRSLLDPDVMYIITYISCFVVSASPFWYVQSYLMWPSLSQPWHVFMSHLYDGWSVRLQYLHAVRLLLANCHTLNLPNVVKFEIVNVRAQLTICMYLPPVSILVTFMGLFNWSLYNIPKLVHIYTHCSTGASLIVMFAISFSTSIHFKCWFWHLFPLQ